MGHGLSGVFDDSNRSMDGEACVGLSESSLDSSHPKLWRRKDRLVRCVLCRFEAKVASFTSLFSFLAAHARMSHPLRVATGLPLLRPSCPFTSSCEPSPHLLPPSRLGETAGSIHQDAQHSLAAGYITWPRTSNWPSPRVAIAKKSRVAEKYQG